MKIKKSVIILLGSALLLTMSACNKSENVDNMKNVVSSSPFSTTAPSIKITPTSVPTLIPTTSPTVAPTNAPINTPTKVPSTPDNTKKTVGDITTYKKLVDCFLDYKFKTVDSTVEGNYDLNQDGKLDAIKIDLKIKDEVMNPYLEVNGEKITFYMDSPGAVQIVDLHKKDKYFEIACFDAGPSADECYHLFRYTGKKIYKLGTIDAGAWINQQGKLISSFDLTRYFKPYFCSAWYEIEHYTLVYYPNDTKKYIGKNYNYQGGQAFFVPCNKKPNADNISWDNIKEYDPVQLKLIDILYPYERTLNFFYVELPTGEKGLLYFWIGD